MEVYGEGIALGCLSGLPRCSVVSLYRLSFGMKFCHFERSALFYCNVKCLQP
jgi:hypothetical protein